MNKIAILILFISLYNKIKLYTQVQYEYDQPRQHIKKQRHYFSNKVLYGKSYDFSSSHIWM